MKCNSELTKEFYLCLSTTTTTKKKKSLLKNAADGRQLFCGFGVTMTGERRTVFKCATGALKLSCNGKLKSSKGIACADLENTGNKNNFNTSRSSMLFNIYLYLKSMGEKKIE